MTTDRAQSKCKHCGSNNIVWDAWIDAMGEVVASFENSECYDCGSERIDHSAMESLGNGACDDR